MALADDWFEPELGYYTLLDENGEELTAMAREISVDDEYISGDNKHYIVTRVDKKKGSVYQAGRRNYTSCCITGRLHTRSPAE